MDVVYILIFSRPSLAHPDSACSSSLRLVHLAHYSIVMIIMVETFSEENWLNILKGDYSYLPPGQSNIVRIFVSSTFGGKY